MATLFRLRAPGKLRVTTRRLLILLDGGRVEGAVEEHGDAYKALESVFGTAQAKKLTAAIAPLEIEVTSKVYENVLAEHGRKPIAKLSTKPTGRVKR